MHQKENKDQMALCIKLALMVECSLHMLMCPQLRWQTSCGRHHFAGLLESSLKRFEREDMVTFQVMASFGQYEGSLEMPVMDGTQMRRMVP